jgi:hypothetical protein
MKTLSWMAAAALAALLVVGPSHAADEVPNINKRGSDEKKFAAKLAEAIVTEARTSVKGGVSLKKFTTKTPKAGRAEWHLTAAFKTAALKRDAHADIVVHIDTSDKDKWEVTRIVYNDDVKSLAKFNRKNVDALVDKLNGK